MENKTLLEAVIELRKAFIVLGESIITEFTEDIKTLLKRITQRFTGKNGL